MSTNSPNMNLIISTVGVDSGLLWEQNLNSSLTVIDGHNHTPGYGIQIPPSGLNINADLTFQTNNAINLRSTRFSNLSSPLSITSGVDTNCLYVANGNLYFNDGLGDSPIQITSGGFVNATSSGITSGSATASFVSSVLVVNSASNTPANIQVGSVLLGNNVYGSNYLTLSPPSSMASNFTLTLPPIPGAKSFLTLDTSGNISSYASVAGGITGSNIASQTVTASNLDPTTVTSFFCPTGSVMAWSTGTAPTGWLLCDGSSYNNSSYPALYAVIGLSFGYGSSSNQFRVPDFRGQFIRGVDNGAGRDPDTTSRTAMNAGGNTGDAVGSIQGNNTAINSIYINDPGHFHNVTTRQPNEYGGTFIASADIGPVQSTIDTSTANTGVTLAGGGSETRPTNAYMWYIIKT